jgi:hypothetical protein
VAIEHSTTADHPEAVPASVIENEIPTYRAISPQAVVSLICGILAIMSFAHWSFLICAVAAVALGFLADRRIVQQSDVLTGRGIAQAGVALGLIFGLSSVTTAAVQDWFLVQQASRFAKTYEGVLNKGSFEDAIWYGQNPLARTGKTPQQIMTEIKKSRSGGSMFDLEQAALIRLRGRLNEGGADIRFSGIEQHGMERRDPYAAARYELHSEGSTPLPEEERYAIVLLKGLNVNHRYEWWVERVGFPYTPDSYKPTVKPPDDGHGHAH